MNAEMMKHSYCIKIVSSTAVYDSNLIVNNTEPD